MYSIYMYLIFTFTTLCSHTIISLMNISDGYRFVATKMAELIYIYVVPIN